MTRANLSEINQKLVTAIDAFDWPIAIDCLKQGADIDCQEGYALVSAVWQRNETMVRYLLESPELAKHANINENPTTISAICINNAPLTTPIFEYLISKGLELKRYEKENLVPAINCKRIDGLKIIHKAGIDLRALNDLAFRTSLEKEKYTFLDYLLDNGVDIHRNNELALRESIESDKFNLAIYLISRGANVEQAYLHSSDSLREKIESFRLHKELNDSLPFKEDKGAKFKI